MLRASVDSARSVVFFRHRIDNFNSGIMLHVIQAHIRVITSTQRFILLKQALYNAWFMQRILCSTNGYFITHVDVLGCQFID